MGLQCSLPIRYHMVKTGEETLPLGERRACAGVCARWGLWGAGVAAGVGFMTSAGFDLRQTRDKPQHSL